MYSINQQFNQDIFKEHQNQNQQQDKNTLGTVGSHNQHPRKNSIFDQAHFQVSSPTSKNSSIEGSAGLTRSLSNSDDPFEVNTSIWNSNQQQPAPGQKFNSISNAATPGFGLNHQIGAHSQRRASYNDYIQPQNNKFNSNYTIWSNTNSLDEYTNNLILQQQQLQFQQQQQQQQAQQNQQQHGDSGFLLSPRHNSYNSVSLDSPGFIPQALLHHGSQHSYDLLDEQLQGSNPNSIQGPAPQINETTPLYTNAYQSVDFYFTQDVYNRVSIKDSSIDELSSTLEELISSGTKNAQLPRFSGSSLPSTQLILIAFKAGRVDVFYLPDNSPLILKIGDLVVVEADRGRDLGKIVKLDVSIDEARLLKYLQHQEQQAALASFDNNNNNNGGSISSFGSNNLNSSPPPTSNGNDSVSPPPTQSSSGSSNVPTLHFPKPIVRFAMPNEVYQIVNKQNDEEKAKKICQLKISSSNLLMNVIDAEYQWDRRKLTFYYNAGHRIDFRDLVRELFRIYKTRIWMCAVGSDVKELPTEAQQQDQDIEGLNHGFNWLDKRNVNMFIPRQFNSEQ